MVSSSIPENLYSFLTGVGKAAIGAAWFGGPASDTLLNQCFRPATRFPPESSPPGSVLYGRWKFAAAEGVCEEDVVVLKRTSHEYEVHVHGGEQSRAYLRASFEREGFQELSYEQWLRRQAVSGLALAVAAELLCCQTERAARLLLGQEQAWESWLRGLWTIIGERNAEALGDVAGQVLERRRVAEHLSKPWRIVLAGLPNVGKSSLINAICGFERAIVHNAPGTTRDVITQQVVVDGWLFEIADTAGQRNASGEIEQAGIERARREWRGADCRVEIRDATRRSGAGGLAFEPEADLVVANKIDLADAQLKAGEFPVSARTGAGVPGLQAALVQLVVGRGVALGEPLPLAEPLVALLAELHEAGRRADWLAAERVGGRLAEFCGQRTG